MLLGCRSKSRGLQSTSTEKWHHRPARLFFGTIITDMCVCWEGKTWQCHVAISQQWSIIVERTLLLFLCFCGWVARAWIVFAGSTSLEGIVLLVTTVFRAAHKSACMWLPSWKAITCEFMAKITNRFHSSGVTWQHISMAWTDFSPFQLLPFVLEEEGCYVITWCVYATRGSCSWPTRE